MLALLVTTNHTASAAALGSVVSSLGLLAAFVAVIVIKGWPTHLPVTALTSVGVVWALGAAAAAWLSRSRLAVGRADSAVAPTARGARPKAAVGPRRAIELPPGVDRESLMAAMRVHFVRLQDAWDLGDASALHLLATPEMLAELRLELADQGATGRTNRTEVVALNAELLAFERLPQALLLSVEFSGMLRELPADGAVPFRELWLLTRTEHGTEGWRLARHQTLF